MRLLLIYGIAVLVFWPQKRLETGKGVGDGIKGFSKWRRMSAMSPPTTSRSFLDAAGMRRP